MSPVRRTCEVLTGFAVDRILASCIQQGINYKLEEYNCRHIVTELLWSISSKPPSHCQHISLISEGAGSGTALQRIERIGEHSGVTFATGTGPVGIRERIKSGLVKLLT